MNYTVLWTRGAEEQLARIWMEAADRNAVRMAADTIEELLQNNPLEQGESRSGDVRVMFVEPLGVFFRVSERHRIVLVGRVRKTSE